MKKDLEVYIHIPFCVKKCSYCDFLSGTHSEDTIQQYIDALVKEIYAHQNTAEQYAVTTVFLGGGTPTILSTTQIQAIFAALRRVFAIKDDAEITIEANPGTVTREKLLQYRKCGINRISFGLQSAHNQELRLLGRIHTFEEFLESYHLARECGFDNVNIDLISAIPGQTLKSWEQTLQQVLSLQPEHISAYSLIIEEGTLFAELYGAGGMYENKLPDEETERMMYDRTKQVLEAAGYHRYEISNYAKEGRSCRHNLGYWERKDYIGLGVGSASLLTNTRYKNTNDLMKYIRFADALDCIQEDFDTLSATEQMEEFMFLGLRKMSGVFEKEFQDLFGLRIEEQYPKQIRQLVEQGLIDRNEGRVFLTGRGIDLSNYVFAQFLT